MTTTTDDDTTPDLDALTEDVQPLLIEVFKLAFDMSPHERELARVTFAQLARSLALYGADEVIPTGQLLTRVTDVLTTIGRHERRAEEKEN